MNSSINNVPPNATEDTNREQPIPQTQENRVAETQTESAFVILVGSSPKTPTKKQILSDQAEDIADELDNTTQKEFGEINNNHHPAIQSANAKIDDWIRSQALYSMWTANAAAAISRQFNKAGVVSRTEAIRLLEDGRIIEKIILASIQATDANHAIQRETGEPINTVTGPHATPKKNLLAFLTKYRKGTTRSQLCDFLYKLKKDPQDEQTILEWLKGEKTTHEITDIDGSRKTLEISLLEKVAIDFGQYFIKEFETDFKERIHYDLDSKIEQKLIESGALITEPPYADNEKLVRALDEIANTYNGDLKKAEMEDAFISCVTNHYLQQFTEAPGSLTDFNQWLFEKLKIFHRAFKPEAVASNPIPDLYNFMANATSSNKEGLAPYRKILSNWGKPLNDVPEEEKVIHVRFYQSIRYLFNLPPAATIDQINQITEDLFDRANKLWDTADKTFFNTETCSQVGMLDKIRNCKSLYDLLIIMCDEKSDYQTVLQARAKIEMALRIRTVTSDIRFVNLEKNKAQLEKFISQHLELTGQTKTFWFRVNEADSDQIFTLCDQPPSDAEQASDKFIAVELAEAKLTAPTNMGEDPQKTTVYVYNPTNKNTIISSKGWISSVFKSIICNEAFATALHDLLRTLIVAEPKCVDTVEQQMLLITSYDGAKRKDKRKNNNSSSAFKNRKGNPQISIPTTSSTELLGHWSKIFAQLFAKVTDIETETPEEKIDLISGVSSLFTETTLNSDQYYLISSELRDKVLKIITSLQKKNYISNNELLGYIQEITSINYHLLDYAYVAMEWQLMTPIEFAMANFPQSPAYHGRYEVQRLYPIMLKLYPPALYPQLYEAKTTDELRRTIQISANHTREKLAA